MRIKVKLAASMLVCLSANRQRSEFPAKAVIATNVRIETRVDLTESVSLRAGGPTLSRLNILYSQGSFSSMGQMGACGIRSEDSHAIGQVRLDNDVKGAFFSTDLIQGLQVFLTLKMRPV